MARPPIAVLLLPRRLEPADERRVRDLLRAPGIVALEPGVVPPESLAHMPGRLVARHVRGQARRLVKRLPGRPVAAVVVDPHQRPLAEALRRRVAMCEVLERPDDAEALRGRLRALGVRVDPGE